MRENPPESERGVIVQTSVRNRTLHELSKSYSDEMLIYGQCQCKTVIPCYVISGNALVEGQGGASFTGTE